MTETLKARTPDGYLDVCRMGGRGLAKLRATTSGYFWPPCPTCGQEFGGHEWDGRGAPRTPPLFPEPTPHQYDGLCPACLEAGVHVTWTLMAPDGWLKLWHPEDIDGPMGHLIRESLGRIEQSIQPEEQQ